MDSEIMVICPICSDEFYVSGAVPYQTRCEGCKSYFPVHSNTHPERIDNLDAESIVQEVRNMSHLDVMLTEIRAIESLIANMDSEDDRDVEETLHWIRYCADIALGKED